MFGLGLGAKTGNEIAYLPLTTHAMGRIKCTTRLYPDIKCLLNFALFHHFISIQSIEKIQNRLLNSIRFKIYLSIYLSIYLLLNNRKSVEYAAALAARMAARLTGAKDPREITRPV